MWPAKTEEKVGTYNAAGIEYLNRSCWAVLDGHPLAKLSTQTLQPLFGGKSLAGCDTWWLVHIRLACGLKADLFQCVLAAYR